MTEIIKVVGYDAKWSHLFEVEAKNIKAALGDNCLTIHHIGSTAVPGLSAKPIIDMLPVVKNILEVDQAADAMKKLGYEEKGECGVPFRRYFQKGGDLRTHNVHIFEEGNPEIDRHIKFRDWMRTHSDDRDAYGTLKTELALKYPNDIINYCLGKDAFVTDIDTKTGFDGLRIVQALTNREWGSARYFRQHYFFNLISVADPYTWTFDHPQHKHFILYQGTAIVGYAHIQLWPERRAAMRIIVIDEPCRNKGIGSDFLKLCERWLSSQGMIKLHIESSPEAYQFYCQNGYIEMPFNDPDDNKSHPRDIAMGKIL